MVRRRVFTFLITFSPCDCDFPFLILRPDAFRVKCCLFMHGEAGLAGPGYRRV